MVAVHGFSDHCNTYGDLFPSLAARGIEVFGFDQRGWGRSVKKPSQRGLTGPTPLVLADISSILRRYISLPPNPTTPSATSTPTPTPTPTTTPSPPVFLFGHSMGGAQVLHWASTNPTPQIRGYILESPFIALSPPSRPSPLLVTTGRLASHLLPRFQMKQALQAEYLSRDPAANEACKRDALCHDMGTLEGLAGMLGRAEALEKGKVKVDGEGGKGSLWLGHGSGDLICEFGAARRWFESCCGVEDRTFRGYEGWFHRLHAEPGEDKKTFIDDVGNWILERCD